MEDSEYDTAYAPMSGWEEAFALFKPGWNLGLAQDGKWGVFVYRGGLSLSLLGPPRQSREIIGVGDSPIQAIIDAHESTCKE